MAMFSPPMPAMTTVSHSSGPMAWRPLPSRKEIFSSTPKRRPVCRARSRGPGRRSPGNGRGHPAVKRQPHRQVRVVRANVGDPEHAI